MGLLDFLRPPAPPAPGGRHSIFNTAYPLRRGDWKQIVSACAGPSAVLQSRFQELIAKNRTPVTDLSAGTVTFGKTAFPVQLIGCANNRLWRWGWDPGLRADERLTALSAELRQLGELWESGVLRISPHELNDRIRAADLAAAACLLTPRHYCYISIEQGGGAVYCAVSGLPEAVTAPADEQEFLGAVGNVLLHGGIDHKILVESLLMWNGTYYEWNGDTLTAYFSRSMQIGFERIGGALRISR